MNMTAYIDWNTHCLKSTYRHEGQFYLEVFGVRNAIPTGFTQPELCVECRCYEGQGFKTDVTLLRVSLIGSLYEVVEKPKQFCYEQLNMFDIMGVV